MFGILSVLMGALLAFTVPILQVADDYESNVKKIIETNGEAYIMFHANWCGACHRFKPNYQEFAETLAESDPSVLVLAIDNDKAPSTTKPLVSYIAYLPSLFHIREGKTRNISDQRGNLKDYISKKKWEAIKPVNDLLTPYSPVGNVLAMIGTLGFKVLELAEEVSRKTKIPFNFLLGGSVALVFILFYGIMFATMKNEQPAEEDQEPDEHFKED